AGMEVVYASPAVPAHIACFGVAYSLMTLAGMLVFGCDVWLQHGEVFTVVFGTFARFAPTQAAVRGEARQLVVRPVGKGLLDDERGSTAGLAFELLRLGTVLYAGLLGPPPWSSLESSLRATLPNVIPAPGENFSVAIRTAGLVGLWLLFLGAYLMICAIMAALVAHRASTL